METTVFIIRHGDVEYPRNEKGERLFYGSDVPLSVEGKHQIKELVEYINQRKKRPEIIYTSPFIRTQQSAEIIAEELGITAIHKDKRLQDTHAPKWIGQPMIELQKLHTQGLMYQSSRDDEKLDHIAERMKNAFWDIVEKNQGAVIILVSHGDPIRALIHILEHPGKPFPGVDGFYHHNYLKKGEAWEVMLNHQGGMLKKTLIPRSDDTNPGSKDY